MTQQPQAPRPTAGEIAQMKTVEQRAMEWIAYGETGISSKTIWAVMLGLADPSKRSSPYDWCYPYDPSDFNRCRKLLELIPEWRERLHEVAAMFPEWKGIVEHWDELDRLFDEESNQDKAPKLYKRMCELHGHL